jgi:hypothetical protein
LNIVGNRLFNAKFTIRCLLPKINGPPGGHIEPIRALLTKRSEYFLESVCVSYLPRLNSQAQRAGGGWENLVPFVRTGGIGGIVENRHTGKFGNGFFEQLQPFPAKFPGKESNASDVAAGSGEALN